MPRYIDAEALLKKWTQGTPDKRWRTEDEFAAFVNMQPTADVQEAKHGKWISLYTFELFARCSLCGEAQTEKFNYCPHCGALMDEK